MERFRKVTFLTLVILMLFCIAADAASKPPANGTYGEGVLCFKLTLPAGWSVNSDKPGFTQFMSVKGAFCWVQRSRMQQMKPADIVAFYKGQGYKIVENRSNASLNGIPGGKFGLTRSESGVEWRYEVTDVYKDGVQWLVFTVASKANFSKSVKDFQVIYKNFSFLKPMVKQVPPQPAKKATKNTQPVKPVNKAKPATASKSQETKTPVYNQGGAVVSGQKTAAAEPSKPDYDYLNSNDAGAAATIPRVSADKKPDNGLPETRETSASDSVSSSGIEATITPVAEIKPITDSAGTKEIQGVVKVDIAEVKEESIFSGGKTQKGRLAYVKAGEVWVRDLLTSADRLLGKGTNPRLSLQGRHLLYQELNGTWVFVDLDGLNRNKLPLNISADNAGLSKDGSRIAYQVTKRYLGGSSSVSSYISDMNGRVIRELKGFERANAEETGRIVEYIGPKTQYKDPFFSPQLNKIYLSAKMGSSWSIAAADLNSNTVKVIASGGEHPVLSPDNKWILYTRKIDKYNRLWLCGIDGKNHRELGVETDYYAFLPDSKTVLYQYSGSLYKLDIETGGKSLYIQGATNPTASGIIE